MVETIAPVVYGDKRRYLGAVALHALAAGLAGASFGMALSALGLVLDAPWGTVGAVVIAIAAAAYAARELLGLPLPIFDRKKQVPDWWRTFYSPHVAATLYGAGLGIGFLTFLRYGTYVVVCVIAFASGEVLWGALLGATFGITRGLTSLMSSRAHDEEQAAGVVLRLERVAVGRGPKTANGLILLLVAVVALATACDPTSVAAPSSSQPAATPPASPSVTEAPIEARRYSRSRSLGRLEDPRIEESSGLAASRSQPDVLWTHNDSGDGPFVYAIGDDGRSLGRWKVTGARAVDWEDIAIGPGAGPADDIYIGDIGDNNARRDRVTVYRFAEPRIDDSSSGTGAATALHFTYPGGSRDAEALLVHPRSGDLYIVTKDFSGRAAVFVARAPLRSGELVALARLRLPGALGGVTGGDISPDGTRLALSTYLGALELFLPVATAPFDDIWKRRPASIAVDGRSQGESIAYSADGTSLIATSEGVGATIQVVRTR